MTFMKNLSIQFLKTNLNNRLSNSTLAASMRLNAMLLKFATSEDRQAALQGRKGLAKTKLGLDEDLTTAQQAHKSKL
jgi:hypothetical protein